MALGKNTYILRFTNGETKEMLVRFTGTETARANLESIIPRAIEQGFLPESCSIDCVELEHKVRILNLNLPLKEQGVRPYEVLVLRDLSSMIRVSIRYKPDDNEPGMESVIVKPNETLGEALADFSRRVLNEYTFYGRKPKRFALVHGRRKLSLKKSLRSQGVKENIEVNFKPRVFFEWPPRLIWPPGPFTTYFLGALCIAVIAVLIIVFTHKPEPITRFNVTIESVGENYIFFGKDYFKNKYLGVLDAGDYVITVYPMNYPIYNDTLHIEPDYTGKIQELSFTTDPGKHFTDTTRVHLRISAYYKVGGRVLERRISINRYLEETLRGGTLHKDLIPGLYEIKYENLDEKFWKVQFNDSTVEGKTDFLFNLADSIFAARTEGSYINFTYSK